MKGEEGGREGEGRGVREEDGESIGGLSVSRPQPATARRSARSCEAAAAFPLWFVLGVRSEAAHLQATRQKTSPPASRSQTGSATRSASVSNVGKTASAERSSRLSFVGFLR